MGSGIHTSINSTCIHAPPPSPPPVCRAYWRLAKTTGGLIIEIS